MKLIAAATLGEALKEGFVNMIIGLCVVFSVLIFLSLVIYCFKFLNRIGTPAVAAASAAAGSAAAPASREALAFTAIKPSAAAPAAAKPAGPGTMKPAEVDVVDEIDAETAAVIMAAVAEECGGEFTVKSIKKSK